MAKGTKIFFITLAAICGLGSAISIMIMLSTSIPEYYTKLGFLSIFLFLSMNLHFKNAEEEE